MTKMLVLKINSCIECPRCYEHYNGHMCSLLDRWVKTDEIHVFCPLDSYDEEEE
jgi:hypothetical protein